jgi:hypothetical protein
LLGNVGDWQNLDIEGWIRGLFSTQQEPLQIDYLNRAFILSNGKKVGWLWVWRRYVIFYKYLQDTNGDGNFNVVTPYQNHSIANCMDQRWSCSKYRRPNVWKHSNEFRNKRSRKSKSLWINAGRLRLKYAILTNDNFQSSIWIHWSTERFPNL